MQTLCLKGVGASYAQARHRSRPAIPDYAAVVDDFLKLRGGFGSPPAREVGVSAHVSRIQTGDIADERDAAKLNRRVSLQRIDGRDCIAPVHRQLCLN